MMLFAFDYNDNRIHIDETQSNKEYFCPYCGSTLIMKKGDIRQHHFAHKAEHPCSDSWEKMNSYDISEWHNEWQNFFPRDNQEVKLSLGEIKHRADVLTGRNVIEFQHSLMPITSFNDRNNFYFNLNYKVIWLFDLMDIVEKHNLSYYAQDGQLYFTWDNPKKAFNSYDVKSGCVDLFFQISDDDSACIVRVLDVSESGFSNFTTTEIMSKKEFLEYVGLIDGACMEPDKTVLETNESYQSFKEKYHINLNGQQERTVQSVEGAVLVLAVPGSGKTTVLVDRLGYMVHEKGIDSSKILAVTYNKSAADDMKSRYSEVFGSNLNSKIDFRTINSLSLEIYLRFCKKKNKPKRDLIQGKDKRLLFLNIYQNVQSGGYPSESDFLEFETACSYAKNMMLDREQISYMDSDYPKFSLMFKSYQETLKQKNQMDFDDQMVFAYWILTNSSEQLAFWQEKYRYICVDEAQDTSKIQHAIIRLLAQGNNIFMVGDEDQSIYGFRAAYPKALLNFRTDYNNPYILRMEHNYRSTPQIIEKAQNFISENKGRYEKKIIAERDDGKPVELISVNSIEEQYSRILSIAKNADKETAFLFRDNESSVILVDSFLRNNIPFRLKAPEMNYFGNTVVRDIVAYLSIIINPFDIDSFKQICNKGIIYLEKKQLDYAVKKGTSKKITVFEAVESQMQYLPFKQRSKAELFKNTFDKLSNKTTVEAILFILNNGYANYLKKINRDLSKADILITLAKQEPDISKYLERLKELESLIKKGFNYDSNIVLSTIHSSKGLEYDTVYMVDVYDGRFPSKRNHSFSTSKDDADIEQEERRLFYVGITRAKNELYFFNIKGKPSSYISSLFPEENKRIVIERQISKCQYHMVPKRQSPMTHRLDDNQRKKQENIYQARAEHMKWLERKANEENEKKAAEQAYKKAYNEVKDLFTQQETPILDSRGIRWVQCQFCGKILPTDQFVTYGGKNSVNLGKCTNCFNSKNIP